MGEPAASPLPLRLTLTSYGPNHIEFDVDAPAPGRLIYLCKDSTHWRCNHPYRRAAPFDEFLEFDLGASHNAFRLQFLPTSQLSAAVVSIAGVFGLAGMWLACGRFRILGASYSLRRASSAR